MRNNTRIPDMLFLQLLRIVGCDAPIRVVYGRADTVSGETSRERGILLRVPRTCHDSLDMAYLILEVLIHENKHWRDYSTTLRFDYDTAWSRRPQEKRAQRAIDSWYRRVRAGQVSAPDSAILELASVLFNSKG